MKLIVSDFDLTFYNQNYDNNIVLVNEFVKKGNIFVIATGRPYGLLEKDIKNKNIIYEYLICSDGAVVLDKNNRIVNKHAINNEIAISTIKKLQQESAIQNMYVDKTANEVFGIYGMFKEKEPTFKLLQELLRNYNIDGYLSCHWLNLIKKGISKVTGIEYLKRYLKLNDSDIYVIGDNINDVSMINKYNGYMAIF